MTPNNITSRPVGACCIVGCAFPAMELLHRCSKCHNYVHILCAEKFKPNDADVADDNFWCDKCSVQRESIPPQQASPQQQEVTRKQQKKPPQNNPDRCSVRNCPFGAGLEKLQCANPNCKKTAHLMCYQGVVLKNNKLDPLPNAQACCCKKCYFVVAGSADNDDDDGIENGKRGSWECDGFVGPTDPNTSLKILLDWWTTEGNYAKYCGKGNNGVKKSHFQLLLANEMTRKTKSKRTARNVKSKIEQIERSFKKAHTFATSETGAGLLEQHGNTTFQKMVRDNCAFYYELVDIMADRAGVQPKVTSYDDLDLEEGSSNEKNSEEASSNGKDPTSDDDGNAIDADDDDDSKVESGLSHSPVEEVVPVQNNGTGDKMTVRKSLAKRKERKSGGSSHGMERAIAVLDNSTAAAGLKMKETERHNRVIEKMEMEKLELEKFKLQKQSWSERADELQFRKMLLREYRIMKVEEKLNDEQILALIPDMKIAIDALRMAPDSSINVAGVTEETIVD